MAKFTLRNLSVLSYVQGFTLWHYRYHGPLRDALASDFLDPAANVIESGDMVLISASDAGAQVFAIRVETDKRVETAIMSSSEPVHTLKVAA